MGFLGHTVEQPALYSVGDNLYGLHATNLSLGEARSVIIRDTIKGVTKLRLYLQGSKPKPWWAW